MSGNGDLDLLCDDLGIVKADAPRLREALTHGSANQTGGHAPTNGRLAFLGDAVIELAIREKVLTALASASLGELSIKADEDVRNSRLARSAREITLGNYLQLGKGAESERDRESVLATALEAVIGAIFAERGFPAAASCALHVIKP